MIGRFWLLPLVVSGLACSGTPIRHYQVHAATDQVEQSDHGHHDVTMSVRIFSSDAAYDDRRIVYRESEVRLDYYHFHRWAAEPGKMVSTVLREIYRRSGRFKAVVGGFTPETDVVLGGRVVALEEVDESKEEWIARVILELTLRDNRTGNLIWNDLVVATEPLKEQSPAGLAHALGTALTRIGNQTTEVIAQRATKRNPPSNTVAESPEGAE